MRRIGLERTQHRRLGRQTVIGDGHQCIGDGLVVDALSIADGDDPTTATGCVVLGLGGPDLHGEWEIAGRVQLAYEPPTPPISSSAVNTK